MRMRRSDRAMGKMGLSAGEAAWGIIHIYVRSARIAGNHWKLN